MANFIKSINFSKKIEGLELKNYFNDTIDKAFLR